MTSTFALDDIIISIRHRRDIGDITSLARSIADVGLLQPIAIRPDGVLIAGERRLAACKALGWSDIPVNVVPLAEIARGELAENTERKDFLPSEIVAIKRSLESLVATPVGRPPKEISESFANKPRGKTTEKVAAFVGVSKS
jgi:ParB/RepB/Spo0J family partition protein